MFSTFMELVFVAFPVVVLATLAGAAAGGLLFGTMSAFAGGLAGLIGGGLLEVWLQNQTWSEPKHKWLATAVVGALIGAIALAAVLTR